MSYKLFRDFHDIMNPTISRKNISDYDIELDVNMAPIEVFYPEIGVENKKILIYIPGKIDHKKFYSELAERTENIVILVKSNNKDECYRIIKYIFNSLEEEKIKKDNLFIMTDTNSSLLCEDILNDGKANKDFIMSKTVLLLPTKVDKEESNKLIIMDDKEDIEKKDIYSYVKDLDDTFFKDYDYATCEHIYSLVNEFLNN